MKKQFLFAVALAFCSVPAIAQIQIPGTVSGGHADGNNGVPVTTIVIGNGVTTAGSNVLLGDNTGTAGVTGNTNTLIGQGQANSLTTGYANSILGAWSASSLSTGFANTILGQYCAVGLTGGAHNVFIGQGAATHNTTGNDNVFVGKDAGNGNISGSNNTALGAYTTFTSGLLNTTLLGTNTQGVQSNTMILGANSGSIGAVNVGIGTNNPAFNTHLHTENVDPENILFNTLNTGSISATVTDLRAPGAGLNPTNDLNLSMKGASYTGNYLNTLGGAPAIPNSNMAGVLTDGSPLAIGVDGYELDERGSVHFINWVADNGGSHSRQECMRINESNGFVGVHTRQATSATGTGAPQTLFHVNLTNPINSNLDPLTQGIRFEGLPAKEPRHTEVVVIDPTTGDLARGAAGTSANAWELFGNGGTTTEWIGTQDPDDFRIRTDNTQRARITSEGNFDFGAAGSNNIVATTVTSAAMGSSNILDGATSAIAVGEMNEITNSTYSAAFGNSNNINSSIGISTSCLTTGNGNTIAESSASTATGNENSIYDSDYSFASGDLNEINESTNAAAIGNDNSISESTSVIAGGSLNQIINLSKQAFVFGDQSLADNVYASAVIGEENEMYNAHGCFIGGGHNISDGWYNFIAGDRTTVNGGTNFTGGTAHTVNGDRNFTAGASHNVDGDNHLTGGNNNEVYGSHNLLLGNYLVGGTSTAVSPATAVGDNIMLIGERINSDLNRSLSVGFNGNRTHVTTERGMSVQINPASGTTDVPVVNFEVEAGVATTGRQAIGTIRSNVRFHNLPTMPGGGVTYPAVVIDPTTGELFRTVTTGYSKPGKGGSDTDLETLKEENEALKDRLAQLESQLSTYNDKFAELERSINQICEKGCAGLNTQNNDVLNQDDMLYQSVPNPSEHNAEIGYYLSRNYTQASIVMYSLDGKQLQSYPVLPNKGEGSVSVNLTNLQTGMYLYRLVVDGQAVSVKKLQKH